MVVSCCQSNGPHAEGIWRWSIEGQSYNLTSMAKDVLHASVLALGTGRDARNLILVAGNIAFKKVEKKFNPNFVGEKATSLEKLFMKINVHNTDTR